MCVRQERWSYYRVSQRRIATVAPWKHSAPISSNFGLDVAPLARPGGRRSDGCRHCLPSTRGSESRPAGGKSSATTLCAQIGGHGNLAEKNFGQHEENLKLALTKSLYGPSLLSWAQDTYFTKLFKTLILSRHLGRCRVAGSGRENGQRRVHVHVPMYQAPSTMYQAPYKSNILS